MAIALCANYKHNNTLFLILSTSLHAIPLLDCYDCKGCSDEKGKDAYFFCHFSTTSTNNLSVIAIHKHYIKHPTSTYSLPVCSFRDW